jgi:hypothetical protein
MAKGAEISQTAGKDSAIMRRSLAATVKRSDSFDGIRQSRRKTFRRHESVCRIVTADTHENGGTPAAAFNPREKRTM